MILRLVLAQGSPKELSNMAVFGPKLEFWLVRLSFHKLGHRKLTPAKLFLLLVCKFHIT